MVADEKKLKTLHHTADYLYPDVFTEEWNRAENFLKTQIGCKFLTKTNKENYPINCHIESIMNTLIHLQVYHGMISKFDETGITFGSKTFIFAETISTWTA